MTLTDEERAFMENARGTNHWCPSGDVTRLLAIIDRLSTSAASQADIAPTIAEDQLADFLRDQFYHHTNSFAELAAAVCGAFDGGVLRANKPSQAAASQGDGGMPRMTEGAGGALAYYDNRPPPPQSDVISTVTLTEEEMATYNAKQTGQSDEIATAFIESPMPTDDQCRVFTAITAYVGEHVPIDKHDAYTPKYVNGLTDAILAALTRSRQDGLPTREKLAQCMYDGGIYGVCFWKELSHDHGDRADFLARADVLHVPYTETSGESSMTTHPHTTLREVATALAKTLELEDPITGQVWPDELRAIEAALVAEREKCAALVEAIGAEYERGGLPGTHWKNVASQIRALT